MSARHKKAPRPGPPQAPPTWRWGGFVAAVAVLAGIAALVVWLRARNLAGGSDGAAPTRGVAPTQAAAHPVGAPPTRAETPGQTPAVSAAAPVPTSATSPARPPAATNAPVELPRMEVNQAVMVTVELDFGPQVPGIAAALREVERRHQPADGRGRVFAILDAYGGPTADGKKLHMSMHVSSEKPGIGALVFRRTGEVLWQSRIVPGTNVAKYNAGQLTILLDNGAGQTLMVDGSRGPASILEAGLRDQPTPVGDFWPDGATREVTYLYSACGCPVKVMVRREGDRTRRVSDLPVIFPDDPDILKFISTLMRW